MMEAMTCALAVSLALATATPAVPSHEETRISIDVKDIDIVDAIRLFSEVGGFQVVVDSGISCKLTLKLDAVLWPVAFDVALRSCQLGYEESGGIYRVASVQRLTEEAAAARRLDEERQRNRARRTDRYRLSYAKAQDLAPLIKRLLSPQGEVAVDARTNTLIIID